MTPGVSVPLYAEIWALGWEPPPPVTGIEGTVRFEKSGLAVAGARVAATAEGASEHARVVSAGEDGRYRMQGLEPGSYRVRAFSHEWGSRISELSEDVLVAEGRVTREVERFLVRGLVIAGEVVAKGSQLPLSRASVGFIGGGMWLAFTDDEGRFTIDGAPAGMPCLWAEAEGFAREQCWLEAYAGDLPFLRFALAAAGVVEGTVRDGNGRAVRGAQVRTRFGAAESDERGHYAIRGIPLDVSSIRISASLGRLAARLDAPGFAPQAARAIVDLVLAPEAGYAVAGRVLSLAGEPLEAVEVLAGREVVATTDGEGRFRVDWVSERERDLSAENDSLKLRSTCVSKP